MKTALLVLDFINDIVHPDGKIAASAGFVKENNVMAHANDTIAFARKNNIPVVFVKVGFSSGYKECPLSSPIFSKAKQLQALQLNTWGTEFHDEINKNQDDLIIIKHRISAFYATPLEAFLRANQIQNLIMCGVSTDMAVQTTAREAHDKDYKVIIVSNACGTATSELHESTLKLLQRVTQVVKSTELSGQLLV
jgi:nicotinamidase-related amidase